MSLTRWIIVSGLLLSGLMLTMAGTAAPPDKQVPKEEKASGKVVPLATTIDFGAALGLDFPSLKALGARIEQARSAADPVGLAGAATELAAAEKAAGKKSPIPAAELFKEAVEMAGRRDVPEELQALSFLVSDAGVKKELQRQAGEAAKRQKARAEGERPRGIRGSLTVYNNSGRTVAIFINDHYVGNVGGNNEYSFYVGASPYNTTKLMARTGRYRFGPMYISYPMHNYRWTLNPLPGYGSE
jgi:hypothetical protein